MKWGALTKEDYLSRLLAQVSGSYEFDLLSRDSSGEALMDLVASEIESIKDLRDLQDPFWKGVLSALQSTEDLAWEIFLDQMSAAEKTNLLYKNLNKRLLRLRVNF